MSSTLNPDNKQRFISEVSLGRENISKKITAGKGSMSGHLFITLTTQTILTENIKTTFRPISERTPESSTFELTEAHLSNDPEGVNNNIHNIIRQILSDPNSNIDEESLKALSIKEGLSNEIRADILSHSNFRITEENIDSHSNNINALLALIKNPKISPDQKEQIHELISILEPEQIEETLNLIIANPLNLDSELIDNILLALNNNIDFPNYINKKTHIPPKLLKNLFKIAINNDLVFESYQRFNLIDAIVAKENVPSELIKDIADFAIKNKLDIDNKQKVKAAINDEYDIENYQIFELLIAIVAKKNAPAELLKKISEIAINTNLIIDNSQRFKLLTTIVAKEDAPAKLPEDILDIEIEIRSDIEEHLQINLITAIITKKNIPAELLKNITRMVLSNESDINDSQRGSLLLAIAKSGKINEEQYIEILAFIKNPTCEIEDDLKKGISQALYINEQFEPTVLKKLHQINIITNPTAQMNLIYHIVSDRIGQSSNTTKEYLLRRFDGLQKETQIPFLIKLLKKLSNTNPSQTHAFNKLLKHMEALKNIIPNIKSKKGTEELNNLIKGLEPGEGIPVSLGVPGHAIIYEINKGQDGSYSFATINTGLGGETLESDPGHMSCTRYTGLTLEQAYEAIKEAINLSEIREEYSIANYQGAEANIPQLDSTIKTFNINIQSMFSEKNKDHQTIPAQKRGTCAWSSLDCWFRRYCEQRGGLEGLYDNFAILTAEEAFNTTSIILKNKHFSVIKINSTAAIDLEAREDLSDSEKQVIKQAMIINCEAYRILKQLRPHHQYQLS